MSCTQMSPNSPPSLNVWPVVVYFSPEFHDYRSQNQTFSLHQKTTGGVVLADSSFSISHFAAFPIIHSAEASDLRVPQPLQRLSRSTRLSRTSGKTCSGGVSISLYHRNKTTGVMFLMTQYFPFLSFCSLRQNFIGDEGAKAIAEALKVNATLTKFE